MAKNKGVKNMAPESRAGGQRKEKPAANRKADKQSKPYVKGSRAPC